MSELDRKPHYRLHYALRYSFIVDCEWPVWYASRVYCDTPKIRLTTADYLMPFMVVNAIKRGALV